MMTNANPTMEQWAQAIISRELGVPVVLNDTGKEPGMYDLRIGDPNTPQVAIECIRAVDPVRMETSSAGPGQGPIRCTLEGDWIVEITPEARVKSIRVRVESLLQACERKGLFEIATIDSLLRLDNSDIVQEMEELGILSADRVIPNGEGKVHLTMTGVGGVVHTDSAEIAKWIVNFLTAPHRADVLLKLQKSNAKECHVFIHVSLGGVPWAVESYLGHRIHTLPTASPQLPSPVSAVWITYAINGLRWDGLSWKAFNTANV